MKKNLFTSASKLIITALLLIFAVISCTKKSNEIKLAPSNDEIASAQSPNASILSTISLKVTVNDVGNKITSDGQGDYVDGLQRVQAILDKNGNFIFTTNTNGNKPAIRSLNYNFDDPIIVFTPPPPLGNINTYGLSTYLSSSIPTSKPIQNMANGESECVPFLTLAGNWRLLFHGGAQDRPDSTSAFAYVTRINSTQWTFTSAGTCLPACIANKAAYVSSPPGGVLYGYYNMPFSFTLTKL